MKEERDELNVRLGKFVARRRRSRGLTQAELAEITDISISTISQIETGVYNPTFDMIKKISRSLRYDTSAFFTDKFESDDPISKIINDIVTMILSLNEKKLLEIRDVISALVKK